MDTIVVAIIVLVLIIMSALTMMIVVFQSANDLADSWKDMEAQSISISDTRISVSGNYSNGSLIHIAVYNEGSTNLHDYSRWDVIIQHQSGGASHLLYIGAGSPQPGEWGFSGIVMADESPEVFDPGILNPGEIMNITARPKVDLTDETARVIVSTPNGVTSQCFVTE